MLNPLGLRRGLGDGGNVMRVPIRMGACMRLYAERGQVLFGACYVLESVAYVSTEIQHFIDSQYFLKTVVSLEIWPQFF